MAVIRTIFQIFLEALGEIAIILVALIIAETFVPNWLTLLSLSWKGVIILALLLVGVVLRTFAGRIIDEITHKNFWDFIKLKCKW